METASMDDLAMFFNTHIKNKPYVYLVIGNVNDMDKDVLKGLGEVKQLSLEELFGY
jgi:hypothetical protein